MSALHGQGGEVLKFIGDGILAMFIRGAADACRSALDAAETPMRASRLNERRRANGLPVTHIYLGLHVGEVFYGNVGSRSGSTSPWSARRSTRPAGSPPCAARSTSRC